MKILYVAGMGIPLRDILSGKTENEVTHAPGFFHPWYKLVQRGHQVDFVVTSNFDSPIDIKVDWFKESNIVANIYDPYLEAAWYKRIFRRAKRFLKLIYYVNKAVRKNNYDFIVCWAFYEGLVGNIIANLYGIPCGMRCMGTMLVPEIEAKGPWITAIKRPAEYMSFKMNKAYFLMTDDGTKGDQVFHLWSPKYHRYDFLFWKTGVSLKSIEEVETGLSVPDHKYLFFAARFDPWKRHDRIIDTLKLLHDEGKKLHLYFAGSVTPSEYLIGLNEKIEKSGLAGFVHFMGSLKQDDVRYMAYHAVANIFMYDYSNLGNVFFETFSVGSVVVGLSDGSLDDYIRHGQNGFLIDDEQDACQTVMKLTNGEIDVAGIRKLAVECSRESVLSLDKRFDAEVDLIERVAETGNTGLKLNYQGIHIDCSDIGKRL